MRDVIHIDLDRGIGDSVFFELPLEQSLQLNQRLGRVASLGMDVHLLPAAASIIMPMMLLPLTVSPSFSTMISESNRLAVLTNMAAGRACTPNLLVTTNSW